MFPQFLYFSNFTKMVFPFRARRFFLKLLMLLFDLRKPRTKPMSIKFKARRKDIDDDNSKRLQIKNSFPGPSHLGGVSDQPWVNWGPNTWLSSTGVHTVWPRFLTNREMHRKKNPRSKLTSSSCCKVHYRAVRRHGWTVPERCTRGDLLRESQRADPTENPPHAALWLVGGRG